MTDHGNLHGAYDFYSKARSTASSRSSASRPTSPPTPAAASGKRVRWDDGGGDDVAGGGAYTHMTMWAETTEGMHNLFRLSSRSSLEGYYYKPRVDRELLAEYAKGLIATTGCPSGAIQTRLRLGQYDEARQAAAEFQEIFGRDNFFLELMDHGIAIEKRVRDDLLRLGKELGIPPLATNDSHYNNPEDAAAHDALICVASGKRLSDTNRLKFDGGGYYIKSAGRDARAVGRTSSACRRPATTPSPSPSAARSSSPSPPAATWRAPSARAARPRTRGSARRSGAASRPATPAASRPGGARPGRDGARDHPQKGYCGYYLVVADFINWAKDNGIRVGPGAARAPARSRLRPAHHRPLPARARPDLRAVPQPRAPLDARLRHRLRRAPPRRGHPLRQRQVRRRPGRPDRHLRPAQGQAGDQGRRRVLDHGFAIGDRITKALPADVMGKGVPLKEIFDPEHKRYGEGGEFRALHEPDADVQDLSRPRSGSRARSATGACTPPA